jgi:hypothetical protein
MSEKLLNHSSIIENAPYLFADPLTELPAQATAKCVNPNSPQFARCGGLVSFAKCDPGNAFAKCDPPPAPFAKCDPPPAPFARCSV